MFLDPRFVVFAFNLFFLVYQLGHPTVFSSSLLAFSSRQSGPLIFFFSLPSSPPPPEVIFFSPSEPRHGPPSFSFLQISPRTAWNSDR